MSLETSKMLKNSFKNTECIMCCTYIEKCNKKAIQYSTGVNNILKKVAKKNKQTLSEYIKSKFMEQKCNKNDMDDLT